MPEGPEIRCFRDSILPLVKNRVLSHFIICNGPYLKNEKKRYSNFRDSSHLLYNRKVLEVSTKGKFMYWTFEGDFYLGISSGMAGSWTTDENKHVILHFSFQENSSLYFQDSRRFSNFEIYPSRENLEKKLKTLGPDVLDDLPKDLFFEVVNKEKVKRKRLCEMLMDQSIFSGIGNYLRAEIMYFSQINPVKIIRDLTENEMDQLYFNLVNLPNKSYYSQATTCGSYQSAVYHGNFTCQIYNCSQCPKGYKIETFQDKNKRTVHWVPEIQK